MPQPPQPPQPLHQLQAPQPSGIGATPYARRRRSVVAPPLQPHPSPAVHSSSARRRRGPSPAIRHKNRTVDMMVATRRRRGMKITAFFKSEAPSQSASQTANCWAAILQQFCCCTARPPSTVLACYSARPELICGLAGSTVGPPPDGPGAVTAFAPNPGTTPAVAPGDVRRRRASSQVQDNSASTRMVASRATLRIVDHN